MCSVVKSVDEVPWWNNSCFEMKASNLSRVITSTHLTTTEKVERVGTWKERLFSWPWTPWKRTVTIVRVVPDPGVYRFNGKYMMHPETYYKLKEKLDKNYQLVSETQEYGRGAT